MLHSSGLLSDVWCYFLRQGHLQMVIQLMRYGADPSLVDGEGYGGLHLAVLFQHMPIAAYLMAKGQVRDTHFSTNLELVCNLELILEIPPQL